VCACWARAIALRTASSFGPGRGPSPSPFSFPSPSPSPSLRPRLTHGHRCRVAVRTHGVCPVPAPVSAYPQRPFEEAVGCSLPAESTEGIRAEPRRKTRRLSKMRRARHSIGALHHRAGTLRCRRRLQVAPKYGTQHTPLKNFSTRPSPSELHLRCPSCRDAALARTHSPCPRCVRGASTALRRTRSRSRAPTASAPDPTTFSTVNNYEVFFALGFLPDPARLGSDGPKEPSSHSLLELVVFTSDLLRFLVPNFL
jgi:hypothetical protein